MSNYIELAKKFRAKKSLGQNFLISKEIIEKIADYADNDDIILEIGSGLGFVTEKLIQKAKKVTAVELDESAAVILEKKFSGCSNFTLI
ncbi:MAG: hypothetical protein LUE64_04840, partial [Candidatus Gastranaerophilales bacterium]|nr:hypothetical protein [Candidatus Gastranaerophilales bacterium]